MAAFSMYTNSRDTAELVNSTHQGIDRCASLLRALLSPTKIQNNKSSKQHLKVTPPLLRQSNKRSTNEHCTTTAHDRFVSSLRRSGIVQTSCDNVRYGSVNKRQLNKKTTTPPPNTTTGIKKKKKTIGIERKTRQLHLPSSVILTNKGKTSRPPIPVAMSTPQKEGFKNGTVKVNTGRERRERGERERRHSFHHPSNTQQYYQPPPPGPPPLLPDGPYMPPPWPHHPYMWCPPPYYQMIPQPGSGPPYQPQGDDNGGHQFFGGAEFASATLNAQMINANLQRSLQEALQTTKFEEEKKELEKEHTAKIEELKGEHEKERDLLTDKLARLENDLKDIEIKWKEKYCVEAELQHAELCDENQMLKLSLAEKETELLQSQDTLLGIRQYLAHMLLELQPSQSDKNWSLIPQKDVLTIQTIINTGHCTNSSRTSNEGQDDTLTSSPPKQPPSYGGGNSTGGWTTSTEVDFRRDLAALDADIARLQLHFNIASQNEQ